MNLFSEKLFKYLTNDYVLLIIRIFLAIVFIFSGVTKLFDLQGFVQIVKRFMLLPETIVPYFAGLLPVVELFLGLCLLSGLYTKWTIRLLMSLLFMFILVIVLSLIRGISVNCGCFGGLFDDVIGLKTVARNFSFLGLLVLLSVKKKLNYRID